jgi:hypothetical protein
MNTAWGFTRQEVLAAHRVIEGIMKHEMQSATQQLRNVFDAGEFEESDESVRRMAVMFECAKVLDRCLIIEAFLAHVKKGSF